MGARKITLPLDFRSLERPDGAGAYNGSDVMDLSDAVETTITLASLRQIQAAIAHFEKGEFECAVTLAAAGEGMLPDPPDDSTYIFGVLRHRDDETTQFNLVINWLKHGKDYKSAKIDQFEAAFIIARGIS